MIPWGSLVVYCTPKGKRVTKRLTPHENYQSTHGILDAEQVHGLDFGQEAHTHTGVPILLQEATLFDRLQSIKRQTQIIYAKDIAFICLKLGAGPNRTILEAGSGSGGLTVALSWFCGPTGRVVSHEVRPDFFALTKRNLEWAGVGSNVELHNQDITQGFAAQNADALFLDVRTPELYLDQVLTAIKPGATVGFLLPTTNQIQNLLLALEQRSFADIEVCELLKRNWKP